MSSSDPITVAILDDVELISRGLEAMCKQAEGPFRIRTLTSDGPRPVEPFDLVLYDGFTSMHEAPHNTGELLRAAHARHLVIYSWNVKRALVEAALRGGASGYLDKRLGGPALTQALEYVSYGQRLVRVWSPPVQATTASIRKLPLPGRLTEREAEIVALIAQGLSNQDIGARLYLSLNTIKSYIRKAYAKMGVRTRPQAVLWALDQGLTTAPPWTSGELIAV